MASRNETVNLKVKLLFDDSEARKVDGLASRVNGRSGGGGGGSGAPGGGGGSGGAPTRGRRTGDSGGGGTTFVGGLGLGRSLAPAAGAALIGAVLKDAIADGFSGFMHEFSKFTRDVSEFLGTDTIAARARAQQSATQQTQQAFGLMGADASEQDILRMHRAFEDITRQEEMSRLRIQRLVDNYAPAVGGSSAMERYQQAAQGIPPAVRWGALLGGVNLGFGRVHR